LEMQGEGPYNFGWQSGASHARRSVVREHMRFGGKRTGMSANWGLLRGEY